MFYQKNILFMFSVATHFSNGTPAHHVKHAQCENTLLLGMDEGKGIREEVKHVARVKQTCNETVMKLSSVVGQCLCSFSTNSVTICPSVCLHYISCNYERL